MFTNIIDLDLDDFVNQNKLYDQFSSLDETKRYSIIPRVAFYDHSLKMLDSQNL